MRIVQIIKKEIIPLSGRQQIVLLLIISSIFQFVLFYTPVLADQAVKQAQAQINSQNNLIVNDSIIKKSIINPQVAKLINSITPPSSIILKTTTLTSKSIKPRAKIIVSTTIKTPTTKILKTSIHIITAYNSEVAQTDSTPCTTANGFNVCKHKQEDTIAANFLKFGTRVKIPELFGNRIFIVRDRMNKKNSNRVDIWMKKRSSAIKFGVKIAKIQIIK